MFNRLVWSPRSNLSIRQSLDLASIYLENAEKAHDPDIALALFHDADTTLSQAKKPAKRSDDRALVKEVAMGFIGLSRALELRGHHERAQEIYLKADKLGVKIQDYDRLMRRLSTMVRMDSTVDTDSTPIVSEGQQKQGIGTFTLPPHIFAENLCPTPIVKRLPDPDEPLTSIPQLVCCLELLNESRSLDDILEPAARAWLQLVEDDEEEQERLRSLSNEVIKTFKSETKDANAVAEIVCLAPVLERDTFRDLLREFYNGIEHSALLDFHLVEGLAQMIQGANPGYLYTDDLIRILGLLSKRLQETHRKSPKHMYDLMLAASSVLDAMADTHVEGLDRETLHEPLLLYLGSLRDITDPFLIYQVAYAFQALLRVPDNETPWQATIRRTGKVVRGVSGLVRAVKGFDLVGLVDGLKEVQKGLAGASDVFKTAVAVFGGLNSLTEGGHDFLEGLKEGFSFRRRCAWYPALRGADAAIRDGDFIAFKQLIYDAPCRLDQAFQWGLCQRLGEIALNSSWNARTRRSAIDFLREIYRNNNDWGDRKGIKEWIVTILVSLKEASSQYAQDLLEELEEITDKKGQSLLEASQGKDSENPYPLKKPIQLPVSPSILDRVQNKPDVEGSLRQLRKQRLKKRKVAVYIQPQAKASLQASDDTGFPLMEKVKEFLDSDQGVFLLLGDSGVGKSTFTRQLEHDLWQVYKKNTGRIPLHINLPAIDKPEQDMIPKQLRKSGFGEPEIRELKTHRRLILICDGYDESQQTHNLYVNNRLNQEGEWKAQMIISCRSEYIGSDYRDRFQPGDRNRLSESGSFQEAIITPFSESQVNDYIKKYVSLEKPLWDASQYIQAIDRIPSMKELVKNPFLMTLSLDVLPRMMDPGEHLSATQATRVALYDRFIEHWLDREKKRLGEKDLSPQSKAVFDSLVDEGFTRNGIDFMKRLAVAIYKEQRGQPIVQYTRFKDEGTWKGEFFSREDEKQLLRDALPLTRNGNQHRFIHRSLLEYGLALAIFDPQDWKETLSPTPNLARRGSTDTTLSFQSIDVAQETVPSLEHDCDLNSPLAWKNLCNNSSILEFLKERAQQEPIFSQQLFSCIEKSKTDVNWRKAASNAITILVRAEVGFHGADLQRIKVPGADLSYGMFDSAQLQGADLRHVNLRNAWLRQADLSGAEMEGAHFWEGPIFKESSSIYSCAYSPSRKLIAIGHYSGDIRVYSISCWETTQTLKGHTKQIWSVIYSREGHQLASSSGDRTIRLWDTETGECTHILTGHVDEVNSVAYSPDGATLASASDDRTVRIWDTESGHHLLTLNGHTSSVMSVDYSPDGKQVASGSMDGTIRLWDVKTRECCCVMTGDSHGVWCVAYSPLGGLMASTGADKTVRLWDLDSESCRTLTGHTDENRCVAFSPRGDMLASSGNDRTVRLWSTETGDCLQVLEGHEANIRCVIFSPKGDVIASGSWDRTLRLWVVGTGVNRQISSSRISPVMSIKYSPQRDQIASGYRDGTIRLCHATTGSWLHTLAGHRTLVSTIDYSPNGSLLVSGSDDKTVRLWVVKPGKCLQTFIGHYFPVLAVAYSPQGTSVASSDSGGTIMLWNVASGECTHILIGHTMGVRGLVFSPDGCDIVSSSQDGTVRLWDVSTGQCHTAFTDDNNDVPVVVHSPHGYQIAAGSHMSVKLWDAVTGRCTHTLTGHTGKVLDVKYSSDGSRIASGSMDKSVRLWDVASGQSLHVIQDVVDSMNCIALDLTPDISRFVTGAQDGSIRQWQVVESGSQPHVRMCWGTRKDTLVAKGASIQGVQGLSRINKQLLEQRGAVGEPYHSHEAIKKVIRMATVVSRLRQNSRDIPPETMLFADPLDNPPEQQGYELDESREYT